MNQTTGPGFSESWYRFQASDGGEESAPTYPPLSAVYAVSSALATARAGMLGAGCSLYQMRMSVVGKRGLSQTNRFQPARLGTLGPSDQANACVYFQLQDSTATKSSFHPIRGVPDLVIGEAGAYVPGDAPGWTSAANAFIALLAGWGWYGKQSSSGVAITNVALVNGTTTISVAGTPFAPYTLPNNRSVRINGVLGAVQVNGNQTVTVNSSSTCYLLGNVPIGTYTPATGVLTQTIKALTPIASAVGYRTGTRRAGRQSFVSRGRSRKRKAR